MKQLIFITYFLVACSVKTVSTYKRCNELDQEMKRSFTRSSEGHYATTSDSLMKSIMENYTDCFKEMDTTQIIERLGTNYILSQPMFGSKLRDSLNLKMMMQYYIATPNRPMKSEKKDGWEFNLGIDNLNKVRIVRLTLYNYK